MREKHLADKVQLQCEITSGLILPAVSAKKVFGQIFATWTSQTLCMDLSVGDLIAVFLNKQAEGYGIRQIISSLSYETAASIQKKLIAYLETLSIENNTTTGNKIDHSIKGDKK
jgi:hypothetical protein